MALPTSPLQGTNPLEQGLHTQVGLTWPNLTSNNPGEETFVIILGGGGGGNLRRPRRQVDVLHAGSVRSPWAPPPSAASMKLMMRPVAD